MGKTENKIMANFEGSIFKSKEGSTIISEMISEGEIPLG